MSDEEIKDRKSIIAEAIEEQGDDSFEEDEEELEVSTEEVSEDVPVVADVEPEPTPELEGDSALAPEAVVAEPPQMIAAPAEFTEEEKADFAQMPPSIQAKVSKRFYDMRRDYTMKTQEAAEIRKRATGLIDAASTHVDRLAQKRIRVEDAVSHALAWDKAMDEDPVGTAAQWLESYGVDAEEILEYRGGQRNGYQNGRNAYQIPPEIQQELDEGRQFRQQIVQQQQSAQADQVFSAIETFKAEKPIFKDPGTGAQIEQAMAPIVKALKEQNGGTPPQQILETAYNYVVNGNPEFRALLDGAEKRKQIVQESERAERATRASSSVTGSPGAGSPASVPKDRRELIEAAMAGRI